MSSTLVSEAKTATEVVENSPKLAKVKHLAFSKLTAFFFGYVVKSL